MFISLLISIVIMAISLFIISKLPTGVEITSPVAALAGGAIIGLLNWIWYALPTWFRAVPAVLTLGLLPLIGSIIVFSLAAWLVQGFRLRWGIWSAIIGAIALSIVNYLVTLLVSAIVPAVA